MSKVRFTTKEGLTRFAIEYYLANRNIPEVKKEEVAEELAREAACFVTVYVGGELRGCIGNYEVEGPLYQAVMKNAVLAGFGDARFWPIEKEELKDLTIEVSVLTPLKEYKPKGVEAVLDFMEKEKPGVIIEDCGQKALFLPQVWEKFETAEEFLSHLCLKANLEPGAWKRRETKYWIFRVRKEV